MTVAVRMCFMIAASLMLPSIAGAVDAQWAEDEIERPLLGPALIYRRGDFKERAFDAVAAMFTKYPDIKFRNLKLIDRPLIGNSERGLYGSFELQNTLHTFCAGFSDGGSPHYTTAYLVFEPRFSPETVRKACRYP